MKRRVSLTFVLVIAGALALNCTPSEKEGNRAMIDVSQLKKSAVMMDEGKYWSLVADSLENTTNQAGRKNI